jgi:O-antigen/teichoic acid export membrane protein
MIGKTISLVRKNFTFLLTSEMLVRAMMLVFTIVLARLYGTENFGIYALALSAGNLFEIIFNLGLGTVFMQRVTGEDGTPEDAAQRMRKELRVFLPLRVLLSLAGFIAMVAFAAAMQKNTETFLALVLAGLYFSLYSIETFLWNCFDSRQKMHFTAATKILKFTVIFGIGILLAVQKAPVHILMYAYIAGATVAIIATILLISKYFARVGWHNDFAAWKKIIAEGWPITLSGTFIFIYNSLDTIIISLTKGEHEVGLYQVSYKITGTIFILATLINQAYLPSLIGAVGKKDGALERIFNKSLKSIFFWSVPIAAGGMILGERIISYVFGNDYLPGVPAFRILVWNCVIFFLSSAMTNLLYAAKKQKTAVKIFFFGALANTVTNIFMIPMYGIIGAALTTVLAELIVLAGLYVLTRKIVKINLLKNTWQALSAVAVMSALMPLVSSESLILTILAGALIYLGGYFLLQIIFRRSHRLAPVTDGVLRPRGEGGVNLVETDWPET